MRLRNALKFDLVFQYRHGFYYAYLFVTIVYIGIIWVMPNQFKEVAAGLIIFSDPSVLGAFFIGAIVMMEKSQNILQGIFITPFTVKEYIFSKVLTLTVLSLLSSLCIVLVGVGLRFNLILLLIAIVLTSILYTLLGFTLAVYAKTTNEYISYSLILSIFLLPALEYTQIYESKLFYLLPGKATLLLIDGAYNGLTPGQFIYSVTILIVFIILAYIIAYKSFYKKVIVEVGG